MLSLTSSCEVKRELRRDYVAILERVKVARREHTETLAAGGSDSLALRSTQRVAAIKALCSAGAIQRPLPRAPLLTTTAHTPLPVALQELVWR